MEEQDPRIEVPVGALSGAIIKPTLCKIGYLQLVHKGKAYRLEPKDDLTPIELWRIQRYIDCLSNSWDVDQVIEEAIGYAKELGIWRHFKEVKNE